MGSASFNSLWKTKNIWDTFATQNRLGSVAKFHNLIPSRIYAPKYTSCVDYSRYDLHFLLPCLLEHLVTQTANDWIINSMRILFKLNNLLKKQNIRNLICKRKRAAPASLSLYSFDASAAMLQYPFVVLRKWLLATST